MLASAEIGTLITAFGTGIGKEEFNIAKLRYHKIIIMTDADVDGSHIRTLLLTFFYRQMPEIIENGYLYIAQPPLYKVKRGQSEVYLKDEKAMDEYLIDNVINDGLLTTKDGLQIAGPDLKETLKTCLKVKEHLSMLFKRIGNMALLEQLFLYNGLKSEENMTNALNALMAQETNVQWKFAKENDIWCVKRHHLGVTETYDIAENIADLYDVKALQSLRPVCEPLFPATLTHKNNELKVFGPTSLITSVFDLGKKGITISRYKGLGEMNAEQLWQTTLDPEARTLLQVKLNHIEEAEEVFSTLMGDVVEPRREFIQTNALNVTNLDT
jgi:DNA gyrase subunit B